MVNMTKFLLYGPYGPYGPYLYGFIFSPSTVGCTMKSTVDPPLLTARWISGKRFLIPSLYSTTFSSKEALGKSMCKATPMTTISGAVRSSPERLSGSDSCMASFTPARVVTNYENFQVKLKNLYVELSSIRNSNKIC